MVSFIHLKRRHTNRGELEAIFEFRNLLKLRTIKINKIIICLLVRSDRRDKAWNFVKILINEKIIYCRLYIKGSYIKRKKIYTEIQNR